MNSTGRQELRDQLQQALSDAYQIEQDPAPSGMSRLFRGDPRYTAALSAIHLAP